MSEQGTRFHSCLKQLFFFFFFTPIWAGAVSGYSNKQTSQNSPAPFAQHGRPTLTQSPFQQPPPAPVPLLPCPLSQPGRQVERWWASPWGGAWRIPRSEKTIKDHHPDSELPEHPNPHPLQESTQEASGSSPRRGQGPAWVDGSCSDLSTSQKPVQLLLLPQTLLRLPVSSILEHQLNIDWVAIKHGTVYHALQEGWVSLPQKYGKQRWPPCWSLKHQAWSCLVPAFAPAGPSSRNTLLQTSALHCLLKCHLILGALPSCLPPTIYLFCFPSQLSPCLIFYYLCVCQPSPTRMQTPWKGTPGSHSWLAEPSVLRTGSGSQ